VDSPLWSRRWDLLLWALCACAVAPLWWVAHPPLQDLPQHVAAIRVLHSHGDPHFGLSQLFDVHLWRTQYLLYYLCADLLSYVVDVEVANRLLVSACVIATPLSMRALLATLGRDERAALLTFPLTYNAHLILGFFNFLSAIPLCLYGLSLAVRMRRAPSRRDAVLLSLVGVACFYMHIVPFAFLALGTLLCALSRSPREVLSRSLPMVPALIAALLWAARSPAGQATVEAAGGGTARAKASFWSLEQASAQAPAWLTDVLRGDEDARLLWAWAGLWIVWAAAAQWPRSSSAPDRLGRSLARRLGLLTPLALGAYMWTPTSYDWIWPIAPRFILLAALLSIIALPRPRPRAAGVLSVLVALAGFAHFAQTGRAFEAFEQEVGDFDQAIEKIPPGKRVAGLIFSRGSKHVRFSPFIHYVAYYQARRGGAVMFTFADFAQSPFSFKADDRPPRVPPRWEWLPQRVQPARDLAWYDYVLVRGGPGRIAADRKHYRRIHRSKRWSVWQRLR